MTTIVSAETFDVHFPTGAHGHGSDAMNKDPDYSAAYLVLTPDNPSRSTGFPALFEKPPIQQQW